MLVLFSLFTLFSRSQGVFNNQTNAAIQKVIEDYPNHFKNIKGEVILSDTRAVNYRSRINIPGAANCMITQSNVSHQQDNFDWSCDLFESNDFDKASHQFKTLYEEIKNTIVRIDGEKPFIINGPYADPEESRQRTTVFFQLLPATGNYQKLKVELVLHSTAKGWKITLSVNDRPDKEETGLVSGSR